MKIPDQYLGKRRVAFGVLVGVLFVSGVYAAPSRAHSSWWYRTNGVSCSGSMVTAVAPLAGQYGNMTSWYGGRETVYWRSQLQVYRSGTWYVANNGQPWLTGVANAAGILPFYIGSTYYWVNSRNKLSLNQHRYWNLAAGIYRVKEYFYWQRSGVIKAGYPNRYNGQAASFCQI